MHDNPFVLSWTSPMAMTWDLKTERLKIFANHLNFMHHA
jgi:hypothetical protein